MDVPLPVREAPKVVPGTEPYRLLFPIGVAIGLVGVGLWIANAFGWVPYPGNPHAALLLLGFQHCFVLGFLMTAMPAFLHSEHCRPEERTAAALLVVGSALSTLVGWGVAASLLYLGTLLVPIWMAVRRVVGGKAGAPPEEFILVASGFLMGIVGAAWSAGSAAGLWSDPTPRFGLRLIGLGMILPVVLGIGGLLVPTFMAMREPLTIPGLARAHERGPRRALYAAVVLLFVGALMLEANRHPVGAAWIRAIVGSLLLLWVWKLFRPPGRADRLSYSLWSAGWILFAGLWLAVLVPSRPLLGEHVIFLGGFGFLTLGIATRVVVRHGGNPLEWESRVIGVAALVLLGAALLTRALSEGVDPAGATRAWLLAGAAAAWMGAWGRWAWKAVPLALRKPPTKEPGRPASSGPPPDRKVTMRLAPPEPRTRSGPPPT
ncbi:MAG TPA: NnrS family protein [Candidatus Eisenbacteria bacterium]|nr:NnrS family protein [Candidatus Eisenbacteria bacterium]